MSFNKSKIFFTLLFLFTGAYAQLAGTPGSFARLGFGARGMGMGNAMIAVLHGENSGYYNPASVKHLDANYGSLSYGALSLDRNFNSLFYAQPIDTNAGVAVRILNAGVSDIDGRDIDGFHTETYSTSENQFSLSFGLKIRKITFGLSTKIYYCKLFEKLSSTGLGFDLGALYSFSQNVVAGVVIKDINAKYRWDTSSLYDEQGNTTTERFPIRRAIGLAYTPDDRMWIVSAEFENSNRSTSIIRFGGEYALAEYLTIRSGLDGWDLKDSKQAHPSFGFTVKTALHDWKPSFTYAYVVEPYNVFAMHIIALSIQLQ